MIGAAAFLVSVWALARMGPLGWFLLTMAVVFGALALLVLWPFLVAGGAGWIVWRFRARLRRWVGWQ